MNGSLNVTNLKKTRTKRALLALSLGCGLALFSGASVSAAHAQRVSRVTGKSLGVMCTQAKSLPLCDAYLSGVMDSEVWSRDYAVFEHANAPVAFCVPPGQRAPQVRNVVVAWLGAHQDAWAQPAGKAVYRALHTIYPCPTAASKASERPVRAPAAVAPTPAAPASSVPQQVAPVQVAPAENAK